MSLLYLLETIFIGPLKLVFEIIYSLAFRFLDNHSLSIVALSLAMNILVLPLYRRADAMQEQARDVENKLARVVAHIKKTFTGDERMMVLQTYYRQNNYKPTDALRGSVSLLLEVPFFMAAYQFLSSMTILSGQSLGPITDLASPDGLIQIAGLQINVLPVLMTAINVISSAIYLKGFPLKTKIQLYGMAAFFLVFLYDSPSGLVFYWTLNNLFSLGKTLFYKIKNPQRVLQGVLTVCTFGLWKHIKRLARTLEEKFGQKENLKQDKKLFLLSCVVLAVLTGFMIPSSVIGSSPLDFVDVHSFHHPINYVISAGAYSCGFFLVWLPVFYWLANDKGKSILARLAAVGAVAAMVNFMFFGWDLGMISSNLQYSKGFFYSTTEKLINLGVFGIVLLGGWLLATKKKNIMAGILAVAVMGTVAMTGWNSYQIIDRVSDVELTDSEEAPSFRISKTGKNVVVIMLDRAAGYFMPYYLEEKPELKDRLSGFTYYSNVLAYGGHTNFGAPPLVGGYDYVPTEMNKRDEESLESKNDEALKVLPELFRQNGYEVTVCDPPYAGYDWVPDLSIFDYSKNDEYGQIKSYITKGYFKTDAQRQSEISNNYRNFFCFGLMRCLPVATQRWMYESGRYHQEYTVNPEYAFFNQTATSLYQATGMNGSFMDSYSALENLIGEKGMTQITADDVDTYLFMANEAAHSPVLLQMPEYTPSQFVDNSEFAGREIKDVNGNVLKFTSNTQMGQYHTGMAMILKLADWLDYLKANGAYDNTKIIFVADHGYNLGQLENMIMDMGNGETEDCSFYYPLLMVKDFGATGQTQISDEFMTNADVPTIATKDVIENPVNPFTGNPINSDEKFAHDQFVLISRQWSSDVNNGNTFIADKWAAVHTDMRDPANWSFYTDSVVLKDNAFPQ